ncbi:hypothetical protein PPSIR1_29353 [Plesiocystis pacifica SIR-1]|uniref:Uncharacterized protein n=1 Tax=Plesiocystis pacifica SIR-1 TaxID=391625 RepID=A6G638_9BACT|nr:hypothetical protein [Plesiocystis pacifica]EDM78640.1 hypothetical protein PPSIR1_29353 [Plesiocystis pacifica SIR-1]
MNIAATTYELSFSFAPTFSLPSSPSLAGPTPAGSFVDGLVLSLVSSFKLDDGQRQLAAMLLFGRKLGAIARVLGVDSREAQARCKALFAATGTDGREGLFELACRLRATRDLSAMYMERAARSKLAS